MLNPKKLNIAYKRYSKNFVNGIKFEDVKEDYDEDKSEVVDIVESNNTKKDHILLIDLDSIASYYLSQWKNDVLITGGKRSDGLKHMQIVVFYQCMAQDLYKVRYPKMMTEYTFREVIVALIHFTMFGWEKEESILFDFIVNRLGGNILDADDPNTHVWFLMELYLQYRKKTVAGTDQHVHTVVKQKLKEAGLPYDSIPDDLEVYRHVLDRWSTSDPTEIAQLIGSMSLFHSVQASEIGNFHEFGDYRYGFYPYEILFLIHVRRMQGLPIPEHFEDFLMNNPEAKMEISNPEPYPEWDPMLRLIDHFYRKNYPEYIPNQHGELFR
ncbi:hypothetical protein P4H42_10205 [Paenibacillus macerans]|uniref:hypothetical protein n=1 Tax=Paenibacillus macerans TaxID=44252 RepID=UPI002DB88496|nr:hypothetical protein [Paenibacillus macerans]MEC0329991.1 hypothetical protein [Paenibacillus macerans]